VRFRGLTLLEVIVSAGILFMVMLLLLNLATTSIWGTKEGGERLAAEARAASLLEEYRSKAFSAYPLNQPLTCPPYFEDGTEYQAVLSAVAVPGSADTTLRRLDVTVTWNSKRGPRQTALSAYVNPLLR
jgi:Tfp pilus assembly protein PilV